MIGGIGLSNVDLVQYRVAQSLIDIACVQNPYNLADTSGEDVLDACRSDGVPFVPFFPLGGFTPLQSSGLDRVAASLKATPMQVALAWLLERSPNILLIPGTSLTSHLRENLAAAVLELPAHAIAELNAIAASVPAAGQSAH